MMFRPDLVQVAAVAIGAVESLDRNAPSASPETEAERQTITRRCRECGEPTEAGECPC